MPSYRITAGDYIVTDLTSDPTFLAPITALADETVRIDPGATLQGSGNGTVLFLTESNGTLQNLGTVIYLEGTAVTANGTGHRIVNHTDGVLLGRNTISLRGDDGQIINLGTIESMGAQAINVTETLDTLIANSGIIAGQQFGIFASNDITDLSIRNSGFITGQSGGIVFGDNVTSAVVVNTGQITAASTAISTRGGEINIINRGEIGALGGFSPTTATAIEYGGAGVIANAGTISAGEYAVFLTAESTGRMINNGTVEGMVALNGDGNILRNNGLIDGFTSGADGRQVIYNTGEITDAVVMGAGNDRYIAQGSGSAAVVFGDAGDDLLISADVATALSGGAGSDDLRTGSGGGMMLGGAGRDIMRAGSGADTFVYTNVTDSGVGGVDVITGFERGVDTFDLSGLGDMPFAFDRTADLRGGGQAAVNYAARADGLTLWIDVDGDGATDMRIVMKGVDDLSHADLGLDPLVVL